LAAFLKFAPRQAQGRRVALFRWLHGGADRL